jgi:DNA-binding NarL/FixJ family response regulator
VSAARTDDFDEFELKVLRLMVSGRKMTSIARELFMSRPGLSMRVARIGPRIGTRNLLQTLLECDRRGLLAASHHEPTCALATPRVCDCGGVT